METPQTERVGRQTQISLCLTTTGREPQQIGQGVGTVATFRVVELGNAGEVQQDEGKLEWIPRAVLGNIHVVVVHFPATANTLREDRSGTLEPHRPIHELERLSDLSIGFNQIQPFLDPLQRSPATVDGKLGRLSVAGEVFFRLVDPLFFQVDPLSIGIDQRLQLPPKLSLGRVCQLGHVEFKPVKFRERWVDLRILGLRWSRLGNFVARDDPGGDPHGPVRVVGRGIDMHADTVTDRKFNVAAIEHREHVILGLDRGIGVTQVNPAGSLVKNGRPIGGLDDQFRLEHPRRVLELAGLFLTVYQEQGHAPMIASLADYPFDDHFRPMAIRLDGTDRPFGD